MSSLSPTRDPTAAADVAASSSRKRNHSTGFLTTSQTDTSFGSSDVLSGTTATLVSPSCRLTKKAKTNVSKGSKVSNEDMDSAINSVISQSMSSNTSGPQTVDANHLSNMQSEITSLHSIIASQSAEITRLTKQLSFVMSYLEITDSNNNSAIGTNVMSLPQGGGSAATVVPTTEATSSGHQSTIRPISTGDGWSVVPSLRPKTARAAAVSAAVTAVYVEQSVKKQRASTVIVSGLRPDSTTPDVQQVVGLCQSQLNVQLDIVHTKRLGPLRPGRVQPLLVALRTEESARQLLGRARQLRQSSDTYIKQNIYINPNLTRAEADAAFQMRERRRLRSQAAASSSSTTTSNMQQASTGTAVGSMNINMDTSQQLTGGQSSNLNPGAAIYQPSSSQ